MPNASFSVLTHRAVIRISGDDRVSFLQGLVSNDVEPTTGGHAVWAAFLTPQGKFLHEFMIAAEGDSLLLDCEAARRDDLMTRLSRFKLRAKVEIVAEDSFAVAAAWSVEGAPEQGQCGALEPGVVFGDPRLQELGARLIAPPEHIQAWCSDLGAIEADGAAYDLHRIQLGVPDGSRDMEVEKALLLENGFSELHGVDFQKGCYIGQELTARTHYRALIKKRLLPVVIEGGDVSPGAPLTADGKDAGEMKSSIDGFGLAFVRLPQWRAAPEGVLDAGGSTKVRPIPQAWMTLPQEEEA